MRSSRLVAVLLLATLAPAQRTWIVNKAGGAGVDFTDIPPAIVAAAQGDTVRVLGNSTVVYSPFTLDKGLSVESLSGAAVGTTLAAARIQVTQIPAGQAAKLIGLQQNHRGLSVDVSSCAGSVTLSRLSLDLQYQFAACVSVKDSASVLVCDCSLTSRPNFAVPTMIAVPLDVVRSSVVVQRCTLAGANGSPGIELFPYTYPSPAMRGLDATIVCVNSSLTGGRGTPEGDWQCGSDGANAMDLQGGSAVVLGTCALTGGPAGTNFSTTCPSLFPGAAAVGLVVIAADATVVGALKNGARRGRSLAWIESPGVATLGAPVTITLRGTPSTLLALHIDNAFGVLAIPGFDTPYLGTLRVIPVTNVTLGTAGTLPMTFSVPNDPYLAGRTAYFVALAIEPGTNALSFTNLGDLLLR